MVNKFIFRVLKATTLAIASEVIITPLNIVLADTSSADYIFLLDLNQQSCQQIGEKYQEIRAFETNSFYINICQKDNQYYYLGEAKTGSVDTIFLPANALTPGEMYRANNGNVAYIVNILPNKAILTIERNGAPVAIENSLDNQCYNARALLPILQEMENKMYYPMSDARIIANGNYIELNPLKTINIHSFYEFSSSTEDNSKTIFNVSSCEQ